MVTKRRFLTPMPVSITFLCKNHIQMLIFSGTFNLIYTFSIDHMCSFMKSVYIDLRVKVPKSISFQTNLSSSPFKLIDVFHIFSYKGIILIFQRYQLRSPFETTQFPNDTTDKQIKEIKRRKVPQQRSKPCSCSTITTHTTSEVQIL
jgi:hypothetical protein